MRHTDRVYVRELGFTAEELAFLKPQAEAMLEPFLKKATEDMYGGKDKKFYDLVREKSVAELLGNDPIARLQIETVHAIAKAEQGDESSLIQETVLADSGFALQHSSFGTMEVGNPTGLNHHTVGSPSIGDQNKSLTFKTASATLSKESAPRLYGAARELLSLTLTLEQFCMMIRGNKGVLTPCGVSSTRHWADSVPNLTNAKVTVRDLEAEIWVAEMPLTRKIRAFTKLLEAGASKKGDYEALIDAAKEARAAFEAVLGGISAIAMEAGIKEGEIAQKQFQSDLNERLGQLKLGSGFTSMMHLLTQDAGKQGGK
jgi:hypothetical protein